MKGVCLPEASQLRIDRVTTHKFLFRSSPHWEGWAYWQQSQASLVLPRLKLRKEHSQPAPFTSWSEWGYLKPLAWTNFVLQSKHLGRRTVWFRNLERESCARHQCRVYVRVYQLQLRSTRFHSQEVQWRSWDSCIPFQRIRKSRTKTPSWDSSVCERPRSQVYDG